MQTCENSASQVFVYTALAHWEIVYPLDRKVDVSKTVTISQFASLSPRIYSSACLAKLRAVTSFYTVIKFV